jgi:hypothetical protein
VRSSLQTARFRRPPIVSSPPCSIDAEPSFLQTNDRYEASQHSCFVGASLLPLSAALSSSSVRSRPSTRCDEAAMRGCWGGRARGRREKNDEAGGTCVKEWSSVVSLLLLATSLPRSAFSLSPPPSFDSKFRNEALLSPLRSANVRKG